MGGEDMRELEIGEVGEQDAAGEDGLAQALEQDVAEDFVDWRPIWAVLDEVRAAPRPVSAEQLAAFTQKAIEACPGESAGRQSVREELPGMVALAAADGAAG